MKYYDSICFSKRNLSLQKKIIYLFYYIRVKITNSSQNYYLNSDCFGFEYSYKFHLSNSQNYSCFWNCLLYLKFFVNFHSNHKLILFQYLSIHCKQRIKGDLKHLKGYPFFFCIINEVFQTVLRSELF